MPEVRSVEVAEEVDKDLFVQSEQVRIIYANAIPSAFGIIVIAVAAWLGLNNIIDPTLLTGWSALMVAVAISRLVLTRQFNSSYIPENAPAWARKFVINTTIAGIGWSMLCLLFFYVDDLAYQTVIVLILLGVLGAAVPVLSSYLPAYITSSLPPAIVLPGVLYTQFDETGPLLTSAVLLYIALIFFISIKTNQYLKNTIQLEHNNKELVNSLYNEVEERNKTQELLVHHQEQLEEVVDERTAQLKESNQELTKEVERRKNAQDALKRNERFLNTIIHTVPDLIWLKDPDGVYLACNNRFENFFGASEAEILGKTDYDFVATELADFFRVHDKKATLKGAPSVNEEWITFANDGHRELLETTKTPMLDESGGLIGVLGIGHDITERKKAEAFSKKNTEILEMIATGKIASEIYDAIALMYEERHPGMRCSMLELSGDTLLHGGAPSLPKEYCEAVHGLKIGPNIGSCGTSTYTGKRCLVENIDTDPKWAAIKDVALPHGMRCCWSEPIKNSSGEVLGAFGMYYNHPALPNEEESDDLKSAARLAGIVMERDHVARTLRQREQELDTIIESLPNMLFVKDAENLRFVRFNKAGEALIGKSRDELIGCNDYDFFPKEQADFFTSKDRQVLDSSETVDIQEEPIETHKGVRFLHTRKVCIRDEDGNPKYLLGISNDITERKQQEERILHQAHFDALTDLPNRFLALDRLSQLINEAHRDSERVAVLFLDLDDFKKINDTMGHDTGDILLKEAASRLQEVMRRGDTIGRLGGDEFIILLSGLNDVTDARPAAETLINQFREPFKIEGRDLILTASIGIALYPDDGDNPSELLRNADSAMYYSKEEGRNTYSYFTKEMNMGIAQRLLIEEQMHGALDRGEFRLTYQPKVDMESQEIIGVEALLRWNNPALGEVSPLEFIPIAEQTGLIVSIGEYVLTEAIKKTAVWQQLKGPSFTMAVNLSPRQFRDPSLVQFIEQAIQQAGIPGKSLELEITEGVLMSGHAYIDEALAAISNLGINLAMDDFGTGYSSLSYLRIYPFNVLKIDREFINDLTEDSADLELVNAAIAMAHGLGLSVVAEGVETEDQRDILAIQGCDFAQGYLFSKPVSPEQVTELLDK